MRSIFPNLFLATCISFAIPAAAASAQEPESQQTRGRSDESGLSATSVPLDQIISARGLRIGIANGIIDFVENLKRARVDLEWQVLPESKELSKRVTRADPQLVKVYSYEISNEALGNLDGLWNDEKTSGLLQALQVKRVLSASPPSTTDCTPTGTNPLLEKFVKENTGDRSPRELQDPVFLLEATENRCAGEKTSASKAYRYSDEDFATAWIKNDGWGRSLLNRNSILPSDYFATLRDHNVVMWLLSSRGISYTVDVQNQTQTIGRFPGSGRVVAFPYTSDKKVVWEIKAYQFRRGSPLEGNSTPPETECLNNRNCFYRFTATAKIQQFELLFPGLSGEIEPTIDAEVNLKSSWATVGLQPQLLTLYAPSVGLKTVPTPINKNLLANLQQEKALSSLSTTLSIVGDTAGFGPVLTQGLLGGTANASVVVGGVFAGNQLNQLVGVNLELGPLGEDVTGGVLFGFIPGSTNGLYLGPSVQASAFTLSGGLRMFENGLGYTEVAPTGVISLDVSRLLGSKKENVISLDKDTAGGNWYKASDLLASDLALIESRLKSDRPSRFSFRRLCDAAGKPLGLQDQAVVEVNSDQTRPEDKFLQFIPRGYYQFQDIPRGFLLKANIGGNPTLVSTYDLQPFTQNVLYKTDYVLEPARTLTVQIDNKKSVNEKSVSLRGGSFEDYQNLLERPLIVKRNVGPSEDGVFDRRGTIRIHNANAPQTVKATVDKRFNEDISLTGSLAIVESGANGREQSYLTVLKNNDSLNTLKDDGLRSLSADLKPVEMQDGLLIIKLNRKPQSEPKPGSSVILIAQHPNQPGVYVKVASARVLDTKVLRYDAGAEATIEEGEDLIAQGDFVDVNAPARQKTVIALVADNQAGEIVLNRGSDDGFVKGMKLAIERVRKINDPDDGTLLTDLPTTIGTLTIEKVRAGYSVARLKSSERFNSKPAAVVTGDRVVLRLDDFPAASSLCPVQPDVEAKAAMVETTVTTLDKGNSLKGVASTKAADLQTTTTGMLQLKKTR